MTEKKRDKKKKKKKRKGKDELTVQVFRGKG